MAHIISCPICRRSAVSQPHPKCRVAELEDLVFKIKLSVHGRPGHPLPTELEKLVLQCSCRPLKEFLDGLTDHDKKVQQKLIWQVALQEHLTEARREFELAHPDPDPVTYG